MAIQGAESYDQAFWERETVSLLALSSVKGLGYWTLYKLAESNINFYEVIKAPSARAFDDHLSKAGGRVPKISDVDWIEFQKELWVKGNEIYRRLKKEEVRVIHHGEPYFPESLRNIAEPPKWLFVQGNLSILHKPSIAIVGTRKPSEDGLFLANYVGASLQHLGGVTVSGLALGIDQIVHKHSIRFQVPTISVLGNGIFLNFPAGSERLRHDILVNGGAIVTEYLPEQGYSGENFVRRNRIQAGLASVLIPVEWKSRSGTAHTVRYAGNAWKPIVCLRMPDWSNKSHDELDLAKELGGEVYTIPLEGEKFFNAVRGHLPDQEFNNTQVNQSEDFYVREATITSEASSKDISLDQNKTSADQLELF